LGQPDGWDDEIIPLPAELQPPCQRPAVVQCWRIFAARQELAPANKQTGVL
jgi:hypothetical protein